VNGPDATPPLFQGHRKKSILAKVLLTLLAIFLLAAGGCFVYLQFLKF